MNAGLYQPRFSSLGAQRCQVVMIIFDPKSAVCNSAVCLRRYSEKADLGVVIQLHFHSQYVDGSRLVDAQ